MVDVRTVADLPCAGRRVLLALTVRKFICHTPTCPRQIFTEQLPDLVQSYARMTTRWREALLALGLATSAQVSERLAPSFGMQVSAPTRLAPPAHGRLPAARLGPHSRHGERARPTAPSW